MRFHWGHGIVVSFVLFIGFIGYFVWRMTTDENANHELVTQSYYEKELRYQEEIDALQATVREGYGLKINRAPEGLTVTFPAECNPQEIQGTVSLYRPSDRHLDSDLNVDLSKTFMLIPDSRLLDGRWDIEVDWTYQGTRYLYKETIYY
jgi:nitrogen fixation protein FixH